ncbi:MAG: hypothetical protein AAB428_02890 [Patescibacteria group bacterium]
MSAGALFEKILGRFCGKTIARFLEWTVGDWRFKMNDAVDSATQRENQIVELFNNHLAKGRLLVRYSMTASHKSEEFRVEMVDIEKVVFTGDEYTGLVCLAYRGGIFGSNIQMQEFQCQVIGPFGRHKIPIINVFRSLANKWETLGDPVVIDGKCRWMEPGDFVGCVKPVAYIKGLSKILPASNSSWVFPFMCLFAGQFRSLVHNNYTGEGKDQFTMFVLDKFIDRFHSFFVQQCWYEALGKPID